MLSRAHLLIERDHERLLEEKIQGIEAGPLRNDNIFEWSAKLQGLPGTMWEGGVFRLYIKFNEHYNTRPPEVCFHTIPYHPNVDMITGKPCLDILNNDKSSENPCTISAILQQIQDMLSNPDLDHSVNHEARDMIVLSPKTYSQMVQDCVAASQRVEAGLNTHPPDNQINLQYHKTDRKENHHREQIKTSGARVGKVSFEDYHLTWSGIATSKSNLDDKSPLEESLHDKPNLQSVHYGMPVHELQDQMERRNDEQKQLMYGRFQKTKEGENKQAKLDHINQMRKIYLQPRTPRKTPNILHERGEIQAGSGGQTARTPHPRVNTDHGEEPWEREVDDLVAWTNNLDEGEI